MKKLLLILFFLPFISFAQEYSEVIDVPDKTANQLYAFAKEWIALSFKSANSVIQLDDPTTGKLIGKGFAKATQDYISPGMIGIPVKLIFGIDFTIIIAVKDKKYKAVISDIYVTPSNIIGSDVTNRPQQPFSDFLNDKEKYKNNTDPATMKNKAGRVINQAYYDLICKTEEEIRLLLKSLESKMKGTEDNW